MARSVRRMQLNLTVIASVVLIVISIFVAVAMIIVSSTRDFTSLETTLFQVLALGAGLSGSFLFGRSSAEKMAQNLVQLHARPAFRRVLNLYDSLYRLSLRIGEFREGGSSIELEVVQAIVDKQIITGESALEDWRDIAPEVVEEWEILRRLEAGRKNDSSG